MMLDGRFDHHFAEIFATSQPERDKAEPLSGTSVAIIAALGVVLALWVLSVA
jgi:hypothetical protein